MKNLVLILSVAISLSILSGCDDSDSSMDPDPGTTPDDIVGHWNMTKLVKDGVDLTDDCTTQSSMSILEGNTFTGNEYDVVQNDCVLTNFGGSWVLIISDLYTFSIFGLYEINMELNEDTLRTKYIHEIDGQHYIEEYLRQQ